MSLFSFLQNNFLVYNISWEDQQVDRSLLQLDKNSSVCMITGGGCNTLSYLLDEPELIHTTDINPHQKALLDLKLSLIRSSEPDHYPAFFKTGRSEDHVTVYCKIRPDLNDFSRKFWDRNIHHFDPDGIGFYHFGTCGVFAMLLNRFLEMIGVRDELLQMVLDPMDHQDRETHYEKIEKRVFSNKLSGIWRTNLVLSMLGIPINQSSRTSDLQQFMQRLLHEIFVDLDPSLNPYWGLYLTGRYTDRNLPAHLKSKNMPVLKASVSKIRSENMALTEMLEKYNRTYSHFILLDHLDWFDHDSVEYQNSWKAILNASDPGTRILLRSVEKDPGFIPEFVQKRCSILTYNDPAHSLGDRVNTYAGTFLCEVI
ncbi:DUF3419 family protein [Balneola sp. MJW-20]|uniref:DUF3419 family protein n=1 Tax=Gracilimonas aurantiaca TaxID=3234185 RepID=UPI0034652BD1